VAVSMRIYLVLVLVLEKRRYDKHDWNPIEDDDEYEHDYDNVHSTLIED
jgi:hypothetical protein